jgi:hypothetical protein
VGADPFGVHPDHAGDSGTSGVRVDIEESWSGDLVTVDVANIQAALDGSLTVWRAHLREAAKKPR